MNKNDLIEKIASTAGLNKPSATQTLNATLRHIQAALQNGEKVSLVGFGAFTVVKRGPRVGRNPRTGEEIKIPAMRVPKFSPGKQLKKAVK